MQRGLNGWRQWIAVIIFILASTGSVLWFASGESKRLEGKIKLNKAQVDHVENIMIMLDGAHRIEVDLKVAGLKEQITRVEKKVDAVDNKMDVVIEKLNTK